MTNEELIRTLREYADWADGNEWEVPLMLADHLRQAAEKLEQVKAYEDTGLPPEEITAMQHTLDEYHKVADPLLRAQADGRLVVLPFNDALTNADRMRTATNQQLAKLLYDSQKELCRMVYKNLGFEDELNFSEDYSDILAWLNAPSKQAEKALEAMKDE